MNMAFMKEQIIFFPNFLTQLAKKFSLNLDDFFLLAYFWDFKEIAFDVKEVEKATKLTENEVLTAFNNLMSKKLITLETKKNREGKIVEIVNLDFLYQMIYEMYQVEKEKKEEQDIYTIFESEFGRPFSSFEYEYIKGWIDKGFSEELIIGALKEAVISGGNSLRYIDAILHNWKKQGFKTMKEVSNHAFLRKEKESPKELFDYNWLDDNEK